MTANTINDARTIAGNGEGAILANRYRIVKQLGQGGMGSVWLAEDTQLDDKLFAIKVLPAILVSNKRAYRQLKDEALVAMKLTHPNIVTLRAFEENDGNPFLVMDYIDGQTLDNYLAEHTGTTGVSPVAAATSAAPLGRAGAPRTPQGGLSESEVLRILRPIAAALDYAHEKGVVHRDVKPGNVMIAKDDTPYILDFGIAREIQETLTRVTGKLSSGTLLYMSPEQLMGEQPKPAQDIYSFAAMAYECLKGEPPFVRGAIEDQIKNKQPDPLPKEVLTGNAAILAAGVMSGLAKKPENRPASCTAVLEGKNVRLKQEEGNGGRAQTPTAPQGGPRSRATPKSLLAVAALALVAAGGWWWLSGQKKVDRQSGPSTASETNVVQCQPIVGREFTITGHSLNMKMKWCPKGKFTMGSPSAEEGRYDDEGQHQVTLTRGFWMGETEVTQGQWKQLMNGETVVDLARKGLQDDTVYSFSEGKKTLREFWGMTKDGDPNDRCGDLNDNVPVYNVSWDEAAIFCRRLTAKERAEGRIPDDYEYRLPTEAEWEYACRAGETASLPNGLNIHILGENNAPALDDIAWYGGNSSVGFEGGGWDTSGWKDKQYPGGRACAREVRKKQPNNWGLYDMIGNVWEWCGDTYGSYPTGSVTDPYNGSAEGAYRVFRGGSWNRSARYCRSAARGGREPGFRISSLGFRVALAPSH